MATPETEGIAEYRKKHFAVKVEAPSDPEWGSDMVVSTTTNGNQWWSTGFSREEAKAVIAAMKKWMKENP